MVTLHLLSFKAKVTLYLLTAYTVCLQVKVDQSGVNNSKDAVIANGFPKVCSDFQAAACYFRDDIEGGPGPSETGEQNLFSCGSWLMFYKLRRMK